MEGEQDIEQSLSKASLETFSPKPAAVCVCVWARRSENLTSECAFIRSHCSIAVLSKGASTAKWFHLYFSSAAFSCQFFPPTIWTGQLFPPVSRQQFFYFDDLLDFKERRVLKRAKSQLLIIMGSFFSRRGGDSGGGNQRNKPSRVNEQDKAVLVG